MRRILEDWRHCSSDETLVQSVIFLFPDTISPASDKPQSQIPCSWRVLHILLCIIGVNNVFFVTSLPMLLRLASLVYHATMLCVSAPVLILYMYNIKWETSIVNIAEWVTPILANSSVITLGSVYMINALKKNRTKEFLRKWNSFCTCKTEWIGDVDTKRFRKARIAFVLSTVSYAISSLIITAKLSYLTGISNQCEAFFTVPNEPWLLKVACAMLTVMFNISSFSVSLTCYFAFVTITFAEEFDKLHQVICNQASCSCPDVGAWEQVRFRHEALVSLVSLHDQLSTMLLGLIVVGNTISLCSSLYYVVVVHTSDINIINVIMLVAVLLGVIIPPIILDKMVSVMFTLNKCDKRTRGWMIT